MNYPKKTGFNLYESRHCAYITYSVKTWVLKNLSVYVCVCVYLKIQMNAVKVTVFSSNVPIIQEAHFGVKNTKSKDFLTNLLKPFCKDFFFIVF